MEKATGKKQPKEKMDRKEKILSVEQLSGVQGGSGIRAGNDGETENIVLRGPLRPHKK